jgi:hypothetical protein
MCRRCFIPGSVGKTSQELLSFGLLTCANTPRNENQRVPFDPRGRLAPILNAVSRWHHRHTCSKRQTVSSRDSFKTAWESLSWSPMGHDTKRVKPGARVGRQKMRQIGVHGHDLRHEGVCRCWQTVRFDARPENPGCNELIPAIAS